MTLSTLTLSDLSQLTGLDYDTLSKRTQRGYYSTAKRQPNPRGGKDIILIDIADPAIPIEVKKQHFTKINSSESEIIKEQKLLLAEKKDNKMSDAEVYASLKDFQREEVDKWLNLFAELTGKKGKQISEYIEFIWKPKYKDHSWSDVSDKSFYRQKAKYDEQGLFGLVPRWGMAKAGETKVKYEWLLDYKAMYLTEEKRSVFKCWKRVMAKYVQLENIPVEDFPKPATFDRQTLAECGVEFIYYCRYGEEAHNRKYGDFIPRTLEDLQPDEVWFSDHHQVNVSVLNEKTDKYECPWLTAWIDMKTGLILGFNIHFEAPNSDQLFESFHLAVLRFGIPKRIYIDNGKDYRCLDFAGGRQSIKVDVNVTQTRSLMKSLGVIVMFAKPYGAQTKIIERRFKEIDEDFSKFQNGYRGRNILDRPSYHPYRLQKTSEFLTFQESLSDHLEYSYNHAPNYGKTHQGLSPLQLWDSENKELRHIANRDELRMFFTRVGKPKLLGKNGYYDNELDMYYNAPWVAGNKGSFQVYIRRAMDDWKTAYCFRADNEVYLGRLELVNIMPGVVKSDLSKQDLREASKLRNEGKKKLKAAMQTLQKVAIHEGDLNTLGMQANMLLETARTVEKGITINKIITTEMANVLEMDQQMKKTGTHDAHDYDVPVIVKKKTLKEW